MLPLLDLLTPIIEKALSFIPDPIKKVEAQLALQKEIDANSQAILSSLVQVDTKQADINIEEAKSSDKFTSRARPAIMWICAFGLAWSTIIQAVLGSILVLSHHAEMVSQLPQINGEVLMTMLGYMLGYGGMRTWEKVQGVQDKH